MGQNRTGCFANPYLRQSHDVGALWNGQAAACVTDENHDGAVGFLDRDRMTQAVIVGNARRHDFSAGICARTQRD